MKNAEPTISVVIPCYNAAPFLRETIDSVLAQTHPALEVIVIDDGSTDDSANIAESYGPPVRVIRQHNQGESVARNRGMDEAKGDWIALLDADDLWLPHKLERELDALSQAPDDIVCVHSDYVVFGTVPREVTGRTDLPCVPERRVRMLTEPPLITSSSMFLTALGREIRFPVGISDGEDRMFFMLLCDHGPFLHVPEPLARYRKSAHAQTSRYDHGIRASLSMWNWAGAQSTLFSEWERDLLRRLILKKLVHQHDRAFWRGDMAVAAQARTFYRELAPEAETLPPLFTRDAPTRPLRAAHKAWNTLLAILPRPLHRQLYSGTRRAVAWVKRTG